MTELRPRQAEDSLGGFGALVVHLSHGTRSRALVTPPAGRLMCCTLLEDSSIKLGERGVEGDTSRVALTAAHLFSPESMPNIHRMYGYR